MEEPFLPSTVETLRWLRDAARRIQEMDRVSRSQGHPLPAECGLAELLRCALSALFDAHQRKNWEVAGDAAYYVTKAEHLARQLEAKLNIVVRHP